METIKNKLQVKNRGFTLLEVLISITIITVGMWLMMDAFILCSNGISAARRRIVALNYAQEIMEDYVMDADFNYANLNASAGSTTTTSLGTTSDNFTKTLKVWYVSSVNLYTDAGSQTDYKRVQAVVSDNNGNIGDVELDIVKTDFQDLE